MRCVQWLGTEMGCRGMRSSRTGPRRKEHQLTLVSRQRLEYSDRLVEAVRDRAPRLDIRLADLRSHDVKLWQALRSDPFRHLRALQKVCHEKAQQERPGYDKKRTCWSTILLLSLSLLPCTHKPPPVRQEIQVGLVGPVGASPLSPRQLHASHLRQLVCLTGVATKVGAVQPKLQESVHYCPATQHRSKRRYVDATDPLLGLPQLGSDGNEEPDKLIHITNTTYPTKDKDGNPLETEFGLSLFKDHQRIVLQEMPESAPLGQLPRSLDLILDHDLVDQIKPGDRVQITGVYRALSPGVTKQASTSGRFPTVVLVNHVQVLGNSQAQLEYAVEDIRNIRQLSQQHPNILQLLGHSLAPSLHGLERIKQAVVLQLLAGMEKNLANGTHLRGDINILLVGDPSTAKSQLLRAAMNMAPLAISTTGKGSSGVGLTAAVTSDPETRERRIEAGAMVLADRGLVCVDEFDKMGEPDRVALHEVMEQQTVTLAKAGLHATLNARCAILAAANPVYGQYARSKSLMENIGLPDSLLSRFDLLFVVLDQMDPVNDRNIATHVVQGHQRGGYESEEEEDDEDRAHRVWYRRNEILDHQFLRKYLHFAKTRIQPRLTTEAREWIATGYTELRQNAQRVVTARSLESLIRLATAHAKARLSDTVEAQPDAQVALELLRYAMYHEEQPEKSMDVEDSAAVDQSVVTDDDASVEASTLVDLETTKRRIWDLLQQNGGSWEMGEGLSAEEEEAIRMLVAEDRAMVEDGLLVAI